MPNRICRSRKEELQTRALDLVRVQIPPEPIAKKVRELHRKVQLSKCSQPFSSRGSGPSNLGHGSSGPSGEKVCSEAASGAASISTDIRWKTLPFYRVIDTVMEPTKLEGQKRQGGKVRYSFITTLAQSNKMYASRKWIVGQLVPSVRVQLRFCALEPSEEQDDLFPPELMLKIKDSHVPLPEPASIYHRPGVAPKRPSEPLDITANTNFDPYRKTNKTNMIVSWTADPQRSYYMAIYLVEKLTADQLFQPLTLSDKLLPAAVTRDRISAIMTAEEEGLCAPTSLRISVVCPLGMRRMTTPCRATSCRHLQCFDADNFLRMNERKPTFLCPVCYDPVKYEDLVIDEYFLNVIRLLREESGNDVQLMADGLWQPVAG